MVMKDYITSSERLYEDHKVSQTLTTLFYGISFISFVIYLFLIVQNIGA